MFLVVDLMFLEIFENKLFGEFLQTTVGCMFQNLNLFNPAGLADF